MILLNLIFFAVQAHACFSRQTVSACIERNHNEAQIYSQRHHASRAQWQAAEQTLKALLATQASEKQQYENSAKTLRLAQAEIGFLAAAEEEGAPLFASGPTLRELPRFKNIAHDWDESLGQQRKVNLVKQIDLLKPVVDRLEISLKALAGKIAETQTLIAQAKLSEEQNGRDAAAAAQQEHSGCMENVCPSGPMGMQPPV